MKWFSELIEKLMITESKKKEMKALMIDISELTFDQCFGIIHGLTMLQSVYCPIKAEQVTHRKYQNCLTFSADGELNLYGRRENVEQIFDVTIMEDPKIFLCTCLFSGWNFVKSEQNIAERKARNISQND